MNDESNFEAPRGIFDSLRALLDSILAILHHRTELLTTELEEELTRLVGVLLWSLVGVFSVIIGAVFLGAMVIFVIPNAYRAPVAAGLGVLFLAVAGFGALSIRKILRAKPRPFDATLCALEKDRDHLRGGR